MIWSFTKNAYRRIRKESLETMSIYRQHGAGCSAVYAFCAAKTLDRFDTLETMDKVRLRIEPDDGITLADIRDEYERPARSAHPEKIAAWQRRVADLEDKGVWFIVGEYKDPKTGCWEHGSSVGMVIGHDEDAEIEVRAGTLAALDAAERAYFAEKVADLESRATYAAGGSQ